MTTRPSTSEFLVKVPGNFRAGTAYLDLETVKVDIPGGYRMTNGEILRRRWSIAMYGVGLNGTIRISDNDNEMSNLLGLNEVLDSLDPVIKEVVYVATREFDEMIAKGRFTNARRAHAEVPFFPFVVGANLMPWRNLRKLPKWVLAERSGDFASKHVPHYLAIGRRDEVMVHLLRDVVSLILTDGLPDKKCRVWCMRVLNDYLFAHNEIFGGKDEL